MKNYNPSKRDLELAQLLASEGRVFNNGLRSELDEFFTNLNDRYSYFSIALAVSLTWSRHAKYEAEFLEYAAGFIDRELPKDNDVIKSSHMEFGAEQLEQALVSYRVFLRRIESNLINFNSADVTQITKLQHRLLSKVSRLIEDRELTGIGPWLFLGPFKIILTHQNRLWSDPNVDNVVLPTGREV